MNAESERTTGGLADNCIMTSYNEDARTSIT